MAEESVVKANRMTKENWESAKLKWKSGKYTLADLAEECGVSINAMSQRLSRHQVIKGSDAKLYEQRLAEANAVMRAEAAAKEEKELRDTATGLKKFILNSANITVRRLMSTMAVQSKDNKTLSSLSDDAKAAKEITIVLKNISEVVDKVVPAAILDNDDLPDLLISQMSDEEIEAAQSFDIEAEIEAMGEDYSDSTSAE